ncbi:hypothetical protein [Bradyrhizobium sp.]|jgi:hypothetical protein|uniref:hypothetical protein n=1 Tax=Bradyrhizobium sp. TaxID=376 RepID=UPI002C270773|nr:hypothetical protein [Bradyrhizobium sp.]HWX58841.1 hypothetical protein [Bradyrhizobium sp.]
MKTIVMATVLVALLVVPAQAQMMGGGGRGKNTSDLKGPEQKKPVVDEKAYKSALERIPEPKEKYDPWGVARPQSGKPQ